MGGGLPLETRARSVGSALIGNREALRVTHVVRSLHPRLGGLCVVPTRMAAAQASAGARVTVITYAESGPDGRGESLLSGVPGIETVRVVYLPEASRFERITARRAASVLQPYVSESDVVHVHGAWDAIGRVTARIARRACVPYVVTPHGMLDPWMLAQKRRKKAIALRLAYRELFNRARFLHALNLDEAGSFSGLGLRSPAEVIPNGVFLEEIDPSPPKGGFRRFHPVLGADPYVLFLGRLHFVKGLDLLIDAFSMLPPEHGHVRLAIVGPDEGQQAMAEQRASTRGIRGRVHFLGPVYGSARYAAMVDACCFCLPSRHEGFSISITEALACGVPAIISRQSNFPEVATANAGRVLPLEARAFANALSEVLGDGELRHQMGENARRLVQDRFTWQRAAERMLLAYRRHVDDMDRRRRAA